MKPLNGKLKYHRKTPDGLVKPHFRYNDIKSAVEGLLGEIEEEIVRSIEEKDFDVDETLKEAYIYGLEFSKDKIRKWFKDVI